MPSRGVQGIPLFFLKTKFRYLYPMLIHNKISRTLSGPYLFIGIVFSVGTIFSFLHASWVLAGIQLVISWFLLASYSGVDIDTEKRQIKEYNMWFGIYKTGQWKAIKTYKGLTLVSMQKVYRLYSRSNRRNIQSHKDFRIYLVNKNKRPSIAIKKCKTAQEAKKNINELALWLKLPVYSIKS